MPNSLLDVSVSVLQAIAREKLAQLTTHQQRIELFKSDLDLLKQHYELKRSFIDKAAQWYGEQSLWQQIILTCKVIGIALLAGILFNSLVVLTIVGVYIGLIYLFTNHNETGAQRENDAHRNILNMETSLTESIQSFNTLEAHLVELFQALLKKNEVLATYIANLDEKLIALNEQMRRLQSTVAELDAVKTALDTSRALVQRSGDHFSLTLDGLSEQVSRYTQIIDQSATKKEMDKAGKKEEALTTIREDLSHCKARLERMTGAVEEQVQISQAQSSQCDHLRLKMDTALSGISRAKTSLDKQLSLCAQDEEAVNEMFCRSEDIHARAKQALAAKKATQPEDVSTTRPTH